MTMDDLPDNAALSVFKVGHLWQARLDIADRSIFRGADTPSAAIRQVLDDAAHFDIEELL